MFRFPYVAAVLGACLLAAVSADAANDVLMLPIARAMARPDAERNLIPSVQLYFATRATPPVAHHYGRYVSHHKSDGFGKSAAESCDWALLGALLGLQKRAVELGGNAVVNIESFYNHHEVRSPTDFECHKGMVVAGVVLRGDVVRLAGH